MHSADQPTHSELTDIFIQEAELLFGKRNTDYAYKGLRYTDSGPCIWFDKKDVYIHLTNSTKHNHRQAVFQLSHEVIHLLSPFGQPKTNVLEEGLAAWFSVHMTKKYTNDAQYAVNNLVKTKYEKPYFLVSQLLQKYPSSIRRLRTINSILGKLTQNDFEILDNELESDYIKELLLPIQ